VNTVALSKRGGQIKGKKKKKKNKEKRERKGERTKTDKIGLFIGQGGRENRNLYSKRTVRQTTTGGERIKKKKKGK